MLMLNPIGQARDFVIPELVRTIKWRKFIDTAAESPPTFIPELDGPEPPLQGTIEIGGTFAGLLRGSGIIRTQRH